MSKGFRTDREMDIRNIREIEKLPVNQLTDHEICKLFLKRFDARALIMVYVDKDGEYFSFGRLYAGKELFSRYRRAVRYCWDLIRILTTDYQSVPVGDDWNMESQKARMHDFDGYHVNKPAESSPEKAV